MFDLHIETDNAAFEGDGLRIELACLLKQAAIQVRSKDHQVIYDGNGNKVGHWSLYREDDDE